MIKGKDIVYLRRYNNLFIEFCNWKEFDRRMIEDWNRGLDGLVWIWEK